MTAPAVIAGMMMVIAASAALFVLAPLRRPACALGLRREPILRVGQDVPPLARDVLVHAVGPGRQGAPPAEHGAEWERLALERAGAVQALRDLELDRATGKLSDADYAELAARYRTRALGVLRRLDALRSPGAPEGSTGAGERPISPPPQQGPGRGGGEAG